jgi:hypothetical protein
MMLWTDNSSGIEGVCEREGEVARSKQSGLPINAYDSMSTYRSRTAPPHKDPP